MNTKIKLTALSNIVVATASVNPIPIIFAEKTFIASPIPRFPGVIATKIDKPQIEARNKAFKKSISIHQVL